MEMRKHNSLLALLGVTFCMGGGVAQAASFTVTRTDDAYDGVCDADCSLREAISAANATSGANTIVLPAATYVVTQPTAHDDEGDTVGEDENLNGDLDVRGVLTIVGAGQQQTTISGSGEADDRILHVLAGAKLTLRNLRLSGGHGSTYGGALFNEGTAVLRNIDVVGNMSSGAFSSGSGGGLANTGTLSVYDSLIADNWSAAGEGDYGSGGGIYNTGTLVVRDSTFSGNRASDDDDAGFGGALFNYNGQVDIGRSTFVGNNSGYGSALSNGGSGQMKVFNSTVSGNSLRYYPEAAVQNGNFADRGQVPYMQLVNVTIANNNGGYGLLNQGSVLIRNSVIAGNRGEFSDEFQECGNNGGEYRAVGLLLGAAPGNCSADLYIDSAQTFNSVLFPLADNNGTTKTHALRRNSPAIDAGLGSCASTDQRGLKRPRDGNGDGVAACDLGAYERAYP